MKKVTFNRFVMALFALAFFMDVNAQFAGGSGTLADPYIIQSADQLNNIRTNMNASYKLANDIDLTDWLTLNSGGKGWEPIGVENAAFSGSLDGNGHFITGFYINRPDLNDVGLFGSIKDGGIEDGYTYTVRKIGIIIPNGKEVKGLRMVGALIGGTTYSSKTIKISECVVIGNVTAVGPDDRNGAAGGLMGYTSNNGGVEITDCYTAGKITGRAKAGGLIGQGYRRVAITSSYSTCETIITGNNASESKAGGLIGETGYPTGGARHDIKYSVALNFSITSPLAGRLVGYEKPNNTQPYAYEINYAWSEMKVNGTVVAGGTETNQNGLNKDALELINQDTYFSEESLYWYDDVWEMGNGEYQLPVLLALPKEKQPKDAIPYLSQGGVGVHLINASEKVTVYPTKTSGKVNVENKMSDSSICVFDQLGRLLLTSQDAEIDLSPLRTGIYLLQVQGQTVKIIKE